LGQADQKWESMMNTQESFGTPGRILARATLLVALLTTANVATAQSGAAPERAPSAEPAKNATTLRAAKQHDPFSPFVWDALGATPSIRLPWQRDPSASKQAAPERVPVAKEAQTAPAIERTATAARQ
jgi:hypothetical protein